MNSIQSILSTAKQTIDLERDAIANLSQLLTDDFANAVSLIYNSKGRVIITGIGKSAIIANKIVATLNSTGTPSVFMHAADAIHGDLGLILEDDVVICISKSGNTPEIMVLVPFIKNAHNTLIAITGNNSSFLAQQADFILNAYVAQEACPNNLAPTTSTTAQLVIGDALAICLSEMKGFKENDFAKFHPGGSLGKKLHLRVKDLLSKNLKPAVDFDESFKNIVDEISKKMLGATAVLKNGLAVGIITDGDLRRFFSKNSDSKSVKASDLMSSSPKKINSEILASEALKLMNKNKITQLIVEDKNNYLGIIHLHNILNEGIS